MSAPGLIVTLDTRFPEFVDCPRARCPANDLRFWCGACRSRRRPAQSKIPCGGRGGHAPGASAC
jgi:hypothetical protein